MIVLFTGLRLPIAQGVRSPTFKTSKRGLIISRTRASSTITDKADFMYLSHIVYIHHFNQDGFEDDGPEDDGSETKTFANTSER